MIPKQHSSLRWLIKQGDCLEVLRKIKTINSIDSLITDPPAGISFMGKAWDDDRGGRKQWIAWMTEVMREAMRVMKPGAHGLVWAIPRTSHWTATALEDAGFEVRDVVTHLFGSGFPKSLNVGKVVKEFEGWGTALKPASEHWILVRKPCSEKTVAANVLKWGTGAINIDASRILGVKASGTFTDFKASRKDNNGFGYVDEIVKTKRTNDVNQGRFPANLVLDEEAAALLDEQTKDGRAGKPNKGSTRRVKRGVMPTMTHGEHEGDLEIQPSFDTDEVSGASRFFYVAKASKADKNAGLEGMLEVECGIGDDRPSGQSMSRLDGRAARKAQNIHPTVKSTKLMSYLITLVTPPGGIVLDPFMGSGSTGVAALKTSFRFLGIEREQEYFSIARMRCLNVLEQK